MASEGARAQSSSRVVSPFHGNVDDVSHICKVFCDEEDSLAIESSSACKLNDILAVLHLNRVTVIQNNKIVVTLVYPSAVNSMSVCCHKLNVATLWALTSFKKLYCSAISKYIFRNSKKEGENVFGDLLENEDKGLPSVVYVSEDDVWSDVDATVSAFCITADHVITLEKPCKGLSCSIWKKSGSEHKLTFHYAVYRHVITKNNPMDGKLVLCTVSAWTVSHQKDMLMTNMLDKDLFNSLFGLEHNLVDSVMVLVGTPSGIVWSIGSKSSNRPQQICDLGQPVVGIVCVKEEDTEKCRTLAIIGLSGKVMTMRHTEDGLLYQSWFTTFPVLDVTVSDNALIHSTGYGLFATDLNQLADDCSPRPCIQSSRLLLSNLHHLTGYSDEKGLCVTKGAQIAGLTRNGELLNIQLHFTKRKADVTTGHDMKDLLTSLSTMTQQLNQIQEKLSQQDKVLSQINLASMLVARKKSKNFADQQILDCIQAVKTTNHGSHVSHKVLLTLRNTSDVVFYKGWKWIVTIQPKNEHAFYKHSSQYCMGLGQLRPGEFRMIENNLVCNLLEDLPFRTDVQLLYTNDSQSVPIRIPVQLETMELNILHFLSAAAPSHDDQNVHALVKSTRQSHMATDTEKPLPTRNFSASLAVSHETFLQAAKSMSDKDAAPECLLLKYLMSENDVQLPASSASILLKFVGQNFLTIHIDSENNGSYIINLQSTSLTVLSSARLAISNKMQQAMQPKDKREDCQMDRKGLSNIMKKIHDIQEKCFLMDEVVMEGLDSSTITNKILDLHETLRKISLPL